MHTKQSHPAHSKTFILLSQTISQHATTINCSTERPVSIYLHRSASDRLPDALFFMSKFRTSGRDGMLIDALPVVCLPSFPQTGSRSGLGLPQCAALSSGQISIYLLLIELLRLDRRLTAEWPPGLPDGDGGLVTFVKAPAFLVRWIQLNGQKLSVISRT